MPTAEPGIWKYLLTGAVAFLLGGGTAALISLLRIRRKHREDGRHD